MGSPRPLGPGQTLYGIVNGASQHLWCVAISRIRVQLNRRATRAESSAAAAGSVDRRELRQFRVAVLYYLGNISLSSSNAIRKKPRTPPPLQKCGKELGLISGRYVGMCSMRFNAVQVARWTSDSIRFGINTRPEAEAGLHLASPPPGGGRLVRGGRRACERPPDAPPDAP